ncbi:MAG TPA: hypothetical protein VE621_18675 [Bryobacteraceae bacterium]|nr:hypothetical protein [Bryobacteraceae bacterium]
MLLRFSVLATLSVVSLSAQTDAPADPASQSRDGAKAEASAPAAPRKFVVEPGTRVPLALINSITTKHAAPGDRVYLETVFPILVDGKIVIPPGSYVMGTVTEVKRPGRLKGRGEIYLRFDSLTLPNGVTRDFRARVGSLDGRASEELDKNEGKIRSEGNKGGDARTVAESTMGGASIGAIAGSVAGRPGFGAGVGAAAGAAAGLAGVLFTRGPEAVLAQGTTLEMVLDRPIGFEESELDTSIPVRGRAIGQGPGPQPRQANTGGMNRRWPF